MSASGRRLPSGEPPRRACLCVRVCMPTRMRVHPHVCLHLHVCPGPCDCTGVHRGPGGTEPLLLPLPLESDEGAGACAPPRGRRQLWSACVSSLHPALRGGFTWGPPRSAAPAAPTEVRPRAAGRTVQALTRKWGCVYRRPSDRAVRATLPCPRGALAAGRGPTWSADAEGRGLGWAGTRGRGQGRERSLSALAEKGLLQKRRDRAGPPRGKAPPQASESRGALGRSPADGLPAQSRQFCFRVLLSNCNNKLDN